MNGRGAERVAAAVAAVQARVPGADVRGIAADLATADGCASFVAQVPAADILVNNLAAVKPTPFDAITDDDWHRCFDTNVMSGIRLSRAFLPGMAASGWDRVVFVSSESALNIPKEMIRYGMTKTAQPGRGRAALRVDGGVVRSMG